MTTHPKSTLREYFESIVIAVILALFIRTFVVQAFKIPTGSMENNLLVGDHLLVNKFVFGPYGTSLERKLLPETPITSLPTVPLIVKLLVGSISLIRGRTSKRILPLPKTIGTKST